MSKKKNNLISIIPAFLFVGVAVGVQTESIFTHAVIGLIVGLISYFYLKHRNKKTSN